MKRAHWLLVGALGLVVAAVLLVVLLGWESSVRSLPGGGEVRVLTVTFGTQHRIRFPSRSWAHHYKKLVSKPHPSRHFSELWYREHGGTGARTKVPSTVIWFLIDSPGLTPWEATLVSATGQTYHTRGGNGASTDGYAATGIQFPVVLPDQPKLHLDVRFHGTPFHFEITNPAYTP